ncbi:hypothetical protein BZG36_01123 [Bifiguratus adelaidae]|uniref:FAS1 domain-containing protein n=1 Tax=Bifiguratus adelaidae TaxID=1938954 RepID=A0A261Y622_9FUNG|nr:hypothetical protein BZG36_01123 [Bifiguratus adelaidae]
MKLNLISAALTGACVFAGVDAQNSSQPNNTQTIGQLLNNTAIPQLSGLSQLLKSSSNYSNIVTALNDTSMNYTLFAPNNNALSALPSNVTGNQSYVDAVLMYHVLPMAVNTSALPTLSFPNTTLNDSRYVNLGNGVPQVISVNKNVQNKNIALYDGAATQQQPIAVTVANIEASNGYIHIINGVLVPPQTPSVTAQAFNLSSFNAFVAAANATEALDTATGITIFAPSNQAISAANSTLSSLNQSQLSNVLQYHVIPNKVLYTTAFNTSTSTNYTTLGGGNVTVASAGITVMATDGTPLVVRAAANGTVIVNNSTVIIPDILTSNGVMHVIDYVLIPANTSQGQSNFTGNQTGSGGGGGSSAGNSLTPDLGLSAVLLSVLVIAGGAFLQ